MGFILRGPSRIITIVKCVLQLVFALNCMSIEAQTNAVNTFNSMFSENKEDLLERDITQLQGGYWLAENQSDSVYLNIIDRRCYHYQKEKKAQMLAQLVIISSDKPQKLIKEVLVNIEFAYLDTLPEPRYTNMYYLNGYQSDTIEQSFIFKQLLTNKLIIQEKEGLKRVFIFNKLPFEKPLLHQIKIDKLREIGKTISGLWENRKNGQFILMLESDLKIENSLLFPPQLSMRHIVFSSSKKDAFEAKFSYSDIQWSDNFDYKLSSNLLEKGDYTIKTFTDKHLSLLIDSTNIEETFDKLPNEECSDSLLFALRNKAWCSASFNDYSQKIDTLVFDFGDKTDFYRHNDMSLEAHGHRYMGHHPTAFYKFFRFKNHYYSMNSAHFSIELWEFINITPNSIKIKATDYEGQSSIKEFFLHPNNEDYFKDGHRIKF